MPTSGPLAGMTGVCETVKGEAVTRYMSSISDHFRFICFCRPNYRPVLSLMSLSHNANQTVSTYMCQHLSLRIFPLVCVQDCFPWAI
jgi:hypothetical protein